MTEDAKGAGHAEQVQHRAGHCKGHDRPSEDRGRHATTNGLAWAGRQGRAVRRRHQRISKFLYTYINMILQIRPNKTFWQRLFE